MTTERLRADLHEITSKALGRIGMCAAVPGGPPFCINEDQRFSLQSVMKMIVGAAVFEAADKGQLSLDEKITVTRKDMSVYAHPLEKIVSAQGSYTTTIHDLVVRAINDSDNAAADTLIAHLGGPTALQSFLDSKNIVGIRIDRDEQTLQSDIAGTGWHPDFVYPDKFEAAIAAVPEDKKRDAYLKYQSDLRDTATPKGMLSFLQRLADGTLLSPDKNQLLINVMVQTRTGVDRLRAGLPSGWQLANKTGTSTSYANIAAATNDVGILIAPDGTRIPIAVFVADSPATPEQRAEIISKISQTVVRHYTAKNP